MLHLCKIVHIPNAYYQISKLADTSGQFKFTHLFKYQSINAIKFLPPASEGWGRYCIYRFLSAHPRGYPSPRFFPRSLVPGSFLGYPIPGQVRMGYPLPLGQNSRASTCYAAGGVPLAFTQDNFFCSVLIVSSIC